MMTELKDKDEFVRDSETKLITEKMDYCYLDLKKNFMNEFDKLRLQFFEEAQQNILHEKQVQIKDYIRLNQDIKIMRDMLNHYESRMNEKHRREINLNKALDFLYNKTIDYHRYYEQRVESIEKRREEYSLSFAKHFYEGKIKRKALVNWKNLIKYQWKKRFQLAYERESQVILNEYKFQSKQLEIQLINANKEINRLRIHKNEHDQTLKKSFMRGVCALNMEAMSIFLKDKHQNEDYLPNTINHTEETHSFHPNTDH